MGFYRVWGLELRVVISGVISPLIWLIKYAYGTPIVKTPRTLGIRLDTKGLESRYHHGSRR